MCTKRQRGMWIGPLLLLLILSLAGCGGAGSAAGPAPTSAPTATATLAPTATASPRPNGTTFACPTTVSPDGTTKTYSDPQLGFTFFYPASWTENTCYQVLANDVVIGNLFYVFVTPRQGRTIAQWAAATKLPAEDVTLTPLADPRAVEVALVTDTFPNGPPPTPPPPPTFVQTLAIIAGTQSFYGIITLLDQQNTTDTVPRISAVQLATLVAPTFVVP